MDGRLKSVSITLAEGQEQNALTFTVVDPKRDIYLKYFRIENEGTPGATGTDVHVVLPNGIDILFTHTGIAHQAFPGVTEFTCASPAVRLNRVTQNRAFINTDFKSLCETLGVEANTPSVEYEHISQRNATDWQFLCTEARRLGMVIRKKHDGTVVIEKRPAPILTLELDINECISFSSSARAQTNAVVREPENPSQERSFDIDPITGTIIQTGRAPDGTHVAPNRPVERSNATGNARAIEERLRALESVVVLPTTMKLWDVSPIDTAVVIMERAWVVDKVTHTMDANGGTTELHLLSASRPKPPEEEPITLPPATVARNVSGFIPPQRNFVVTSGFRTRRRPNHAGVDTSSGRGSPVYAMASGTVIDVNNTCQEGNRSCGGRYGRRVFIRHNDIFTTRYAHLQSVTVSNGQSVQQGDIIGYEGNTGDSTGSHLHSEIRKNGTPVNPERYWNRRLDDNGNIVG
jgi:murein DD-endopeptidase MepM/ murein hydrolase activator NlpD